MNRIDRERFGGGALPPWVHHEHWERWKFAAERVGGKTVADCACGTGRGSHLFATSGAAKVRAFDVSAEAVEATTALTRGLGNITVQQADGRNLPLERASIDLFISFETIEHIKDDTAFVDEVARTLRSDGTFICSTPNRTITMPGKHLGDGPWNPFHVREYSMPEFVALLGRNFGQIELFGQNPKRRPLVRALNAIGRLGPGHLGGRLNSALKLPRFLAPNLMDHRVVPCASNREYEYIVAVCRSPKRATGAAGANGSSG